MGRVERVVWGSLLIATFGLASGLPANAAGAIEYTSVPLAPYHFGHLSQPDAIVASVGANGVAFETQGDSNGPWSFDVGTDGSVYLLDQFDYRVLVWDQGRPGAVARKVLLPKGEVHIAADMAVGSDGTIYVSYVRVPNPHGLSVMALDPTGHVRWTTPLGDVAFNSVLRTGPDRRLYWAAGLGTDHFRPVTTPDGRPLSLDQQHAQALALEPAPGGSLEEDELSEHETRFAVHDGSGHVTGAWSITAAGATVLSANQGTPAMVEGDPVVMLDVAGPATQGTPWEHLVLRLGPDGDTPARVALDPRAVFGDVPITGLRVGPDGALYQLRSNIDTGVTIAKYSLGAEKASASPSPSVTPSAQMPSPSATTPAATISSRPSPVRTLAAEPAGSSRAWVIPVIVGAVALVGLTASLVLRRRTRSRT